MREKVRLINKFLHSPMKQPTPFLPRLLKQYEAQVAEEGELTEEELPEEILDQVEENVSKDRQHYVVSRSQFVLYYPTG